MAEPDHPIPNLPVLRAKLDPGLAVDLVDGLTDVKSMSEAAENLATRLRARVSEIEERLDAAPEVG